MIAVSFNTAHIPWPFLNQTQDSLGKWNDLQFYLNSEDQAKKFKYLVVYNEINKNIKTNIPKCHRILFIAEPRSITTYQAKYLNQFGIVVCPYPLKGFKGKQIISQTSLPWHFGVDRKNDQAVFNFKSLEKLITSDKKNKIAVVCSKKAMTPEHRLRLAFIEQAKEKLGDRLDIYGRGFQEIDDKAEAILGYQFHLVLENNFEDHFWTEKLADAYLGIAYPVFSGCRNIENYFSNNMLTSIDITKPEDAIQKIKKLLDTQDFYEKNLDFIKHARHKVMYQYNMFPVIETLISEIKDKKNFMMWSVTIRPMKHDNKRKLIDILYPYKVKVTHWVSKKFTNGKGL